MKAFKIAILILIIAAVAIFLLTIKKDRTPSNSSGQASDVVSGLKDGRQCYTYSHAATKDEPYAVSEFIDMTVAGNAITGTKKGTQNGPDMTNGYEGTINGTIGTNTITDIFSYTVEGSSNKEQEIYRLRADQIGIEKLRYPLIEQKGMLVPDTTKPFAVMLYARVGCTASN